MWDWKDAKMKSAACQNNWILVVYALTIRLALQSACRDRGRRCCMDLLCKEKLKSWVKNKV